MHRFDPNYKPLTSIDSAYPLSSKMTRNSRVHTHSYLRYNNSMSITEMSQIKNLASNESNHLLLHPPSPAYTSSSYLSTSNLSRYIQLHNEFIDLSSLSNRSSSMTQHLQRPSSFAPWEIPQVQRSKYSLGESIGMELNDRLLIYEDSPT